MILIYNFENVKVLKSSVQHKLTIQGVIVLNFLKLTKNFIQNNFIVCATASIFILMISGLAAMRFKAAESEKNLQVQNKKTIILDPGHGGEDGGAVGDNKIIEKNINLNISLKLRDFLEAAGYNIIMTRDKDISIYDSDAKSTREKKRSDLHNRMEIIKSNSNPDTIFVSIHQNKFPNPKYFGTQIFYSKNDPNSQNLATSIKNSVTNLLQPENTRETKPADKNIFLLRNAQIPAVVVECGFISNPDEAQKLMNSSYQKNMAFSIFCGISNYFLNA